MIKSIVLIGTILKIVIINKLQGVFTVYFQRLRDLREDADLNQTAVARLLHTSQTVYSRYERGYQTIPVEHLLILADFYNVSTDYILGRTNEKSLSK